VGLITRVASAKKGTRSLKTTVPEGIAEFLELSDKDELEWKMHIQDDIRIATVQKKEDVEKKSVELARYSMNQKKKRAGDL
jgi:hypothetical protein